MSQIAIVRLAPGQAGYYDEISGIYLTAGKTVAHVPAGTNCSQLRRSVRMGTLILEAGTLGGDIPEVRVVEAEGKYFLVPNEDVNKPVYLQETKVPEPTSFVEVKPTEAPKEELKVEPVVTEEAAAEVKEEVKEATEEVKDLAFDYNLVEEADKVIVNFKVGKDVSVVSYKDADKEEKVEAKKFTARTKKREGSIEIERTEEAPTFEIFINDEAEAVANFIVNPKE